MTEHSSTGTAELRQAVALEIWHRFANASVEEWENETHKAEYLLCADDIIAICQPVVPAQRQSDPSLAGAGAKGALNWAVSRWHDEVANRPLKNIHRRALDTTWRQVIRYLGGDDEGLCGPRHDELASSVSSTERARGASSSDGFSRDPATPESSR